jgi:hypothetical protein
MLGAIIANSPQTVLHLEINPRITIDGDEATSTMLYAATCMTISARMALADWGWGAQQVGQLDARADVQLGEDRPQVGAHRVGGHAQPRGRRLIGVAVCDQPGDPGLRFGQRGPAAGGPGLSRCPPCSTSHPSRQEAPQDNSKRRSAPSPNRSASLRLPALPACLPAGNIRYFRYFAQ